MWTAVRRVLWRPTAWAMVSLGLAYWALAWATPYRPLNEMIIAVATGFCAVGSISYLPAALRVLLAPHWPERDQRAVLAVWLIMFSVAVNALWSVFWRLSGQPSYLVNNALYDGWRIGIIVGIGALVQGPNLFGRGVTPAGRWTLALAWAVAIGIVLYLTIVNPDLDWLAAAVRPWLDNGVGYGSETP